jgi:hypothetical protein
MRVFDIVYEHPKKGNKTKIRRTCHLRVKLPAHRPGHGFPAMQFHLYCAPSCLSVGRDFAYPAVAGPGHLPVRVA